MSTQMGGAKEKARQTGPVPGLRKVRSPGRRKTPSREKAAAVGLIVTCTALAVGSGVLLVRGASHDLAMERQHQMLVRRGVVTEGRVVDTATSVVDAGDERRSKRYEVTVEVAACECTVTRRISTLSGHGVGSVIPMRYDPADPRRVELAADRLADDVAPLVVTLVLALIAAVACPLLAWDTCRRRRRVRRRRRGGPITEERGVRGPGEGEGQGDDGSIDGTDDREHRRPGVCVRMSTMASSRVERHDPGSDVGGHVLLRHRDLVVLAPTTRSSAGWEAGLRRSARAA